MKKACKHQTTLIVNHDKGRHECIRCGETMMVLSRRELNRKKKIVSRRATTEIFDKEDRQIERENIEAEIMRMFGVDKRFKL